MGGRADGTDLQPNGPLDLRFHAPRFALDWPGSARIRYFSRRAAQGNPLVQPKDFRIAVVYFGSTLHEALKPTTIAPETDEAWRAERRALDQALSPESFRKNLGSTDFRQAFERAEQIFAQWRQERGTRRLKAIVVLTDGAPSVEQPRFDASADMSDLATYTRSAFPAGDDFRLYALAMNDSRDNYWPRFQAHWEQITEGRARLVANNREVGAYLEEILLALVEPLGGLIGQPAPCGTMLVPPYLEELTLDIHKVNADARPTICEHNVPLARLERSRVEIKGRDEPIEQIAVRGPAPGPWRIDCPAGADVRIFKRELSSIGVRAVRPGGVQYRGLPVDIEVQLLDRNGAPLRELADPRYALQVTASLQPQGGRAQTIALAKRADAVYGGTAAVSPSTANALTLRVRVATRDAEGKPLDLVQHELPPVEVRTFMPRLADPPASLA